MNIQWSLEFLTQQRVLPGVCFFQLTAQQRRKGSHSWYAGTTTALTALHFSVFWGAHGKWTCGYHMTPQDNSRPVVLELQEVLKLWVCSLGYELNVPNKNTQWIIARPKQTTELSIVWLNIHEPLTIWKGKYGQVKLVALVASRTIVVVILINHWLASPFRRDSSDYNS